MPTFEDHVIQQVEDLDQEEEIKRAWTRGFFSALAYHSEGTDAEEGIASTGLLTAEAAVQAGAEQQDVEMPNMRSAFRSLAGKRRVTS